MGETADDVSGFEAAASAQEAPQEPKFARGFTELYSTNSAAVDSCLKEYTAVTQDGLLVDFVLVCELPEDMSEEDALHRAQQPKDDSSEIKEVRKRLCFEANLRKQGLVLERELGGDQRTVYVKIHAPMSVLMAFAEKLQMSMPLEQTDPIDEARKQTLEMYWNSLEDDWLIPLKRYTPKWMHKFINPLEKQTTLYAPFSVKRKQVFRNWDNDKLFSSAQRAFIVLHILQHTEYQHAAQQVADAEEEDSGCCHRKKKVPRTKIGIERLLRNGTYEASFPLHDSRMEPMENLGPTETEDLSQKHILQHEERKFLYNVWGRFGAVFNRQPLNAIRHYFGDKLALYFAFLGFLTGHLVIPSLIGILVLLYGIGHAYNQDHRDVEELCASNFTMCALCDQCENWQLSDGCNGYKASYLFDNSSTIFFSFAMSLWASVFLDLWARRNAELAFLWDLGNFDEIEPERSDFRPYHKKPTRKDPVTDQIVNYYPSWLRKIKYGVTLSFAIVMIAAVAIVVVAVMVYRLAARAALIEDNDFDENRASAAASLTAALINLAAILLLNEIYQVMAYFLTEWENHQTNSRFEYHLTLKIFVFQFVNSYASLVYIAFFKGRFGGIPGDYNTIFGQRQDYCPVQGCFLELSIQLFVLMVGKQTFNNIMEIFVPRVASAWRNCVMQRRSKQRRDSSEQPPWVYQYVHLHKEPELGLFQDYLELTIQFGFCTLFVGAFPLAPLFALLNNIIEIRVDSSKLVQATRRVPAYRAASIGIWAQLLRFISITAVITNGLVLAFTSDFIPREVYSYQNENSLAGFIAVRYPLSPVTDTSVPANQRDCHYYGLYDENGDRTQFFFEVMAWRLGFFIIFEHVVFLTKACAVAAIRDVPKYISLAEERMAYTKERMLLRALRGQMEEQQGEDAPQQDDGELDAGEIAARHNETALNDVVIIDSDGMGTPMTDEDGQTRRRAQPSTNMSVV